MKTQILTKLAEALANFEAAELPAFVPGPHARQVELDVQMQS
jgi:hypothetical protein